MSCEQRIPREEWQQLLIERNPEWAQLDAREAPDGDADLESRDFSDFEVPPCPYCGGLLKPDVVFFGESVPRDRVDRAMQGLHQADAMLVVGSSLMVYSGFRFAQAAAEAGIPIAAINLGSTRADSLLSLKVSQPCAETLGGLVGILVGVAIPLSVQLFADIRIPISALAIVVAFGVSCLVGLVFGILPANRAASLNPTDALRYE